MPKTGKPTTGTFRVIEEAARVMGLTDVKKEVSGELASVERQIPEWAALRK